MNHRALTLPEVLEALFNFTDRNTNARSARVCKVWSDIALNRLWLRVEGVYNLFSLIAPIGLSHQSHDLSYYYFKEHVNAENYTRFLDYARRVQYITIKAEKFSIKELLIVVARSRTTLCLLPNLKKLATHCHTGFVEYVPLFLHSGLRSLTILNVQYFDPKSNVDLFKDVVLRSPQLKKLNLHINEVRTDANIHVNIWKSFSQLSFLTKLTLPLYALTSVVISELSVLPKLESLLMDKKINSGYAIFNNVVEFSPRFEANAFPALRELELAVKIQCLQSFLSMEYAPVHNLTHLHAHILDVAKPSMIEECFRCLIKRCSKLSSLSVDLNQEVARAFNNQISGVTIAESFSVEFLLPLCKLSQLKSFAIAYPRPLKITNGDLQGLVEHWPKLEYLHLNDEPLVKEESLLTLDILERLAEMRPNLKGIKLFVNTTTPFGPRISFATYEQLQYLSLGASAAPDPETLALYLNRLCPTFFAIEEEIGWSKVTMNAMNKTFVENRTKYKECWSNVNKLITLLAKARQGDQEELKYLKYEPKALSRHAGH